jgi:hypothetical protein
MPPRKSDTLSKEAIAAFLTAEMEGLNQRALHYDEALSSKVNFYLVVVTALAGGLVLAAGTGALAPIVLPVTCIVLAFLFQLGMVTFGQCLDLSATVTTLYRRVGRIRHWFIEQQPALEPYLPFTVGDDRPQLNPDYALLRGMESILLLVNAALCGVFFALLWIFSDFFLFHLLPIDLVPLSLLIAFLLGTLTFYIAWQWQVRYADKFMKEWEARQKNTGMIHFPSESGLPKNG